MNNTVRYKNTNTMFPLSHFTNIDIFSKEKPQAQNSSPKQYHCTNTNKWWIADGWTTYVLCSSHGDWFYHINGVDKYSVFFEKGVGENMAS